MKIKNILFLIFLSFYLLSFNNVFGLQIKSVHVGSKTTDPAWLEVFNDGENISNLKDYSISNYRLGVSAQQPTNHNISRSVGDTTDFFVEKDSTFYISNSKLEPNFSEKIFYSAFSVAASGGTISILDKSKETISCGSYKIGDCQNINSGIIPGETSTTSSDTTTNTKEKIVYVYVPQNNQEKYGDIKVLLPEEKIVPALAEVEYTVKVTDSQKKAITDLDFHWSFGDGGEQSGKDALYTYIYPGEYILIASADGYTGGGKARMNVKVVNPDIIISEIGMGEKENFIILKNNTDYDLFLSNFYLSLDGNFYKLPKNLMIAKNKTLKLSGEAIGFKLPANNISLLYPNKNLLISYKPEEIKIDISLATTSIDEENTIFTENILSKVQTFTPKIVTVKAKENSNQKVANSKDSAKSSIDNKTEIVYLKRLVLGNGVSDLIGKTQNKKVDTVYKDKSVDTKLINWVKNLIY